MDDKKQVKECINWISQVVFSDYATKGHKCFMHEFSNDRLGYLLADKGIEKRIEKRLLKQYGLRAKVTYKTESSAYKYLNYILKIKILGYDLNLLNS